MPDTQNMIQLYNSGSSVNVVKTVFEEIVYIRAQHEIA